MLACQLFLSNFQMIDSFFTSSTLERILTYSSLPVAPLQKASMLLVMYQLDSLAARSQLLLDLLVHCLAVSIYLTSCLSLLLLNAYWRLAVIGTSNLMMVPLPRNQNIVHQEEYSKKQKGTVNIDKTSNSQFATTTCSQLQASTNQLVLLKHADLLPLLAQYCVQYHCNKTFSFSYNKQPYSLLPAPKISVFLGFLLFLPFVFFNSKFLAA